MALYHLNAKTGTRATGASALAKAQYIQREDRYARVPDALVHTVSRNLPAFAGGSAAAYWDAADVYERANGRLFKEIEFALPIELEPGEQRALAERFAEELTAGEQLPYTLAIHSGKGTNPHCHVLLSERVNDGIARPAEQWFRRWNAREPEQGGARKSRALHPRAWLETIRERWAELVNRALERAGFRERVDHRSLAAQGIDRTPQIHLGPNVVRMKARGLATDRADQAKSISARNRELERSGQTAQNEPAARSQEGLSSGPDALAAASPNLIGAEPDEAASPNRTREAQPSSELTPGPSSTGGPASNRHSPEDETDPLDRPDPTPPDRPSVDRDPTDSRLDSASQGDSEPPDSASQSPQPLAERDPGGRSPEPAPSASRSSEPDPGGERSAGREPPDSARGREPSGRGADDRTAQAVRRQLRAMGCSEFEVGIFDRASGRMMNRTWSSAEVPERLSLLRRMNARGNDIYIRPAPDVRHGLVLLDDLTPPALERLRAGPHRPALVVETSPQNYQAWVRVPEPASAPERAVIARRLAHEYSADPASADANHYGRLAGFTNQKEEHRSPEGIAPFALLRSSTGELAPGGEDLLRQAGQELPEAEQERAAPGASASPASVETPSAPTRPHTLETEREATELFREQFDWLSRTMNDRSRVDFSAAIHLASRGFGRATIEQAIRNASPELEERKRGHVQDYVSRTAEGAIEAQARRLERARDRERSPGWEDELER